MSIHQHKKNLVLPIALVGGAVFNKWIGYLTFLSPYLIFVMLFITYCKLSFKDLKVGKFEAKLFVVQVVLSAITYLSLFAFTHVVAEGVFICVFVPTATAAPVITAMLGGNISKVATYSLVYNFFLAIAGPVVLAAIGDRANMTFLQSFTMILAQVAPLLLAPLAAALALRYVFPSVHRKVASHQQLSFYIWAISLFIVVGSCVSFAINAWTPDATWEMVALSIGALAVCVLQFRIGRSLGKKWGDPVSCAQSLMQKNTVLAVWLAMAYMNPIASIGPAAYIAWQNIVNSWQLVRHDARNLKTSPS